MFLVKKQNAVRFATRQTSDGIGREREKEREKERRERRRNGTRHTSETLVAKYDGVEETCALSTGTQTSSSSSSLGPLIRSSRIGPSRSRQMATQRAMKCNLFRLGITPREDTICLTRRTPRSNEADSAKGGGRGGWIRARPESSLYGQWECDGTASAAPPPGPPCSIPTERDRRTMSHLNLLSAPYSPYPVGLSCGNDRRCVWPTKPSRTRRNARPT